MSPELGCAGFQLGLEMWREQRSVSMVCYAPTSEGDVCKEPWKGSQEHQRYDFMSGTTYLR